MSCSSAFPSTRTPAAPERSILVTSRAEENLDALLALAEPLARGRPARELILVRLTGTEELGAATALLNGRRESLSYATAARLYRTLAQRPVGGIFDAFDPITVTPDDDAAPERPRRVRTSASPPVS